MKFWHDTIFWKWSSGEVKSIYLLVLDRYRPPRSTGQRQLKEGRLNELQDSFLVVLFLVDRGRPRKYEKYVRKMRKLFMYLYKYDDYGICWYLE